MNPHCLLLPVELWRFISNRLPLKDSFKLRATCKKLYLMIQSVDHQIDPDMYSKVILYGTVDLVKLYMFVEVRDPKKMKEILLSRLRESCIYYSRWTDCDVSVQSLAFIIVQTRFGKNIPLLKLLLTNETIDPNALSSFGFRRAVQYGRTEIVRLLLSDKRVDPSVQNNFAIRKALEYGYTEIFKLLKADQRVDQSAVYHEAVNFALRNGHHEIVKLLHSDE